MLLGVDVGTTGARALLVDPADGRILREAVREYPLQTPRPLWAQQNPEDWWTAAEAAIAEASAGHTLTGIGLSGQMHGVALLGADGKVLTPAQIWCDSRCHEECQWITQRVGPARLIELTSNPALVGFSAPKLLWTRNHQKEIWKLARHFLLPKDYVRYRLTGEFHTEVSDASGTLLFDVANRRWSQEMLEALEMDPAWLPQVHESTVPSASWNGVPVVGGGGDQAAGAVGAGIVKSGLVSVTVGSSGVVFAHADQPVRDSAGRVHTFCHAVPGKWHVMGVTQGAGLSLRWFRDEFAPGASYPELLERLPEHSQGLLYLPYLMGERTPHLDPQARGVFCGLTGAHRFGHLLRSVLEGVAFSLKDCLEILREMRVPVHEVRLGGGGARSPEWRQILADVLDQDQVVLEASEGPAYGAALLAGVGTGVWRSVEEACEPCIRVHSRTTVGDSSRYLAPYVLFREVYQRLAPVFPRL